MIATSNSLHRRALLAALPAGLLATNWARSARAGVDPRHNAWDALLKRQVVVTPAGNASTVRYDALMAKAPDGLADIKAGKYKRVYTDYDRSLNDARG